MITQDYLDTLLALARAIDEGIVNTREWLDELIEQREAVRVRLQKARAEFHGIILEKEYTLSHNIKVYIKEYYDSDVTYPMNISHISTTHFILERFGFQFSIPIRLIGELTG